MSFFRRLSPLPAFWLCTATMMPACLLDWEEKDTVIQECPASTSCDFECTDAERCLVECSAASSCTVSCASSQDCIVECGPGASCDVQCEDAGDCSLDCESGASGTCAGPCAITSVGTASCELG